MKKILFFSGHIAGAQRKARVLFIAEAVARRGHSVQFITVDYSLVRWAKERLLPRKAGQVYKVDENLFGYLWLPAFHPLHPREKIYNWLSAWTCHLYPYLLGARLIKMVREADVVVVESGNGLVLAPRLKRLNPSARFILIMSDLMETLGFHPTALKMGEEAIDVFELVFSPSQIIADKLRPFARQSRSFPQGHDKTPFDIPHKNPFRGPRQAISVGDMLFDGWAIENLAHGNPDWIFHLFGKRALLENGPENVVSHGEVPFQDLVPYLQHADVGIAPYRMAPQMDYLCQSSLKLVQYAYCGLPIVAPAFASNGQSYIYTYTNKNKDELLQAFRAASERGRGPVRADILDWDAVVDGMARQAIALW